MSSDAGSSDVSTLLAAVTAVADELHPGRRAATTSLDSRLDLDLGFDSLGRVELLVRLEQVFAVALPERLAVEAETPRDLLRAVAQAPRAGPSAAPLPRIAPVADAAVAQPTGERPTGAETWLQVLDWHAARHPDFPHIRFYEDLGEGEVLSYAALRADALRLAAGMLRHGIAPGDAVALMLPTGPDYFRSFIATLSIGAVAVPLYPPFRQTRIEEHIRRQSAIMASARTPLLVTTPDLLPAARMSVGRVATLRAVVAPAELADGDADVMPRVAGADTALLQYTSGSTGAPKGVILSHANLLANVRAIGEAIAINSGDVVVSWLPLYHDMGLIGTWLGSLYHGLPLVLMSPLAFIARPARWLQAIHRYRGSITAAPNFAFELCLRRVGDDVLAGLDLSSLRVVLDGAEAVGAETTDRFIERFAKAGFQREAMMPVYGLAECSVGLTFPPLGRGPRVDVVQRQALTASGRAIPAAEDQTAAMRFVCCGVPLPGHQLRVVDNGERELPERREGRIQFRGPSATSGYIRHPQATAALFHGEWLDSGDLGYLAGGELYVTGRAKDIIIKAGHNIYPEEIEETVGDIAGIRKGNVAAFGLADRREGTERLVVVAETRKTAVEERRMLEEAVAGAVIDLLGMPPDRVVLAPPNTVLKTSSGKIRRAACRKLFEDDSIGRPVKPAWLQLAVLRLEELGMRLGRLLGAARAAAFAAYAWALVGLVGFLAWLLAMLLPRPKSRWKALRLLLWGLAAATRTPVTVRGREAIPAGPVVFVANHASYLDSFVLSAVLPGALSFVAKAELDRFWATALPLRRLGTTFVERFDRAQSLADAGGLAAAVDAGRPLVFFAEGTLTRMTGLLPFHMGAFELAGRLGLPCVPVAIRGTRSILRGGSWFPRAGTITVTVGSPIDPAAAPAATPWAQACWLRDETRRFLLQHVGEPDLAYERPPV